MLLEDLSQMGNQKSNKFYEANLQEWFLVPSQYPSVPLVRENFIKAKYASKLFIDDDEGICCGETGPEYHLVEDGANDQTSKPESLDDNWYHLEEIEEESKISEKKSLTNMRAMIQDDVLNEGSYCWHPSLCDWEQLLYIPILGDYLKAVKNNFTGGGHRYSIDENDPKCFKLQGYLEKKNYHDQRFEKCWVMLESSRLIVTKSKGDPNLLGDLPLKGVLGVTLSESNSKPGLGFEVKTVDRVHTFWSENESDSLEWAHEIRKVRYILNKYAFVQVPLEEEVVDLSATNRLQRSDTLLMPVIADGYLTKMGGYRKNLKRRYFVMRGAKISYYKTESVKDGPPLNEIPLAGSRLQSMDPHSTTRPFYFTIATPKRTFHLWADNQESMDYWVENINYVIDGFGGGARKHPGHRQTFR
eukprot:CAMPEP_0115001094 /NCGR_PEP_ID=MMETSP0216-20121206/17159_1 /TAXON_ID=223996 /ORGANISM="Protocruzia adherens, Strain Boccale" /LENGTH=414 /DNA_ID=CAMNT_0002366339 /DNA_START=430 /DNA_END=1674 /DNA_ORIENTATION=+